MTTKIITIKMKANKPVKVFFNPPIKNASKIQLVEYHNNYDGYMLMCDIIDPNYSLSNIGEKIKDNYITLKPSNILAIFSDSKLYPKIPIQNKQELSNLTLEILNEDMKTLNFKEIVTLVLKLHCF